MGNVGRRRVSPWSPTSQHKLDKRRQRPGTSTAALPFSAPALGHLRAPHTRSHDPRVTDSSPARSALISSLPLLPQSKRELFWLSTPGNREREHFSLTSVKPAATASLAAPSAGLLDSKAGGGPTPGRRATSLRHKAPALRPTGDPPGAAQDPDGAGQTKVRRPGSAPSLGGDSQVPR